MDGMMDKTEIADRLEQLIEGASGTHPLYEQQQFILAGWLMRDNLPVVLAALRAPKSSGR